MKKLFLIGLKDVKLAFRDRAALIFMLLAPFLLTIGLGLVTGAFSNNTGSGISNIPVTLVNQDDGELGKALVELFQSQDLTELVTPTLIEDAAAARRQVDDNQTASAVIIPAGFSRSIIPEGGKPSGEVVQIEIYTNPTRPTSSGVIKTIVEQFLSRVEVGRVGGEVTVTQLIQNGLIDLQSAAQVAAQVGFEQAAGSEDDASITLKMMTNTGEEVKFNVLAYLAPGMALMFLMFTASNGGRSLLTERAQGTLPRLLVSPTTSFQVLGGKIFGVYLTGVAQMLILILTSSLLFRLRWGDPLGVLVLVLTAVFGAVGWGMLITAAVRTPGQVSAIGSAVMLTFGILGGSFIDKSMMPAWLQTIGKITPNAWGLDGFLTLALGGKLPDIVPPVIGLLIMGGVLFVVSVILFNRKGFGMV